MEMIRVLGVGIVGTFLSVSLAHHRAGYGLLTGIATGCLLLMMLLGQSEELIISFRELAGVGSLSSDYMSRVIRILGLACLMETGSRISKDGGQGNIALKVELCGRVMILCTLLPAVRELLRSAQAVLGTLAS